MEPPSHGPGCPQCDKLGDTCGHCRALMSKLDAAHADRIRRADRAEGAIDPRDIEGQPGGRHGRHRHR